MSITGREKQKVPADISASVRREERQEFARKLYNFELLLGNVFHTVNNENDCEHASEQLETLIDQIRDLREECEL